MIINIFSMIQSSVLLFLNLGGGEIFLVILVALLFFGSKKTPELAKGIGKGIRELKDAMNGVQREINNEINKLEVDKEIKNLDDSLNDANKKKEDI
jgi:sec-independent protein translocase protein TatA